MQSGKRARDLLDEKGLKKTSMRLLMLNCFLNNSQSALSQAEIEERIKEHTDRVTIFRTLKTFEEKGIIHRIVDSSGTSRFALCGHNCSTGDHHDAHVHFSCQICGKIYCLLNTPIPAVIFPKGYVVKNIKLVSEGICKNCS